MGEKLITQNRRAHHEYHILDRYEAGIELRGTEVKSLRDGHITLKDSYADVDEKAKSIWSAFISIPMKRVISSIMKKH